MPEITLPKHILAIIETLAQAGFEAFAVGGCVRDLLMGRVPHDYDLTTNALPQQTLELFPRAVPTGLKYGTVTVLSEGGPVEVTTFRVDGDYTDARRPDAVQFSSKITDDLSRRDFTVNAMAYSPMLGLCDPFDGREDAKAKLIRAVGDPETRFHEDALRILRAFRFSAQLGFTIEQNTLRSALKLCPALSRISVERIAAELFKILLSDRPEAIEPLLSAGGLSFLGISFAQGLERISLLPKERAVRLAGLCLVCGAGGEALSLLKLDNETRLTAAALLSMIKEPLPETKAEMKLRFSKLHPQYWAGFLSLCSAFLREDTSRQQTMLREILSSNEPWCIAMLAVDGSDLMQNGFSSTPVLGKILKTLLKIVIEDPRKNQKDILLQIARKNRFN